MSQSTAPFVAFRHRNFRLLCDGQIISFSGSMMQNAALLWQVSLLVPPERREVVLLQAVFVYGLATVVFGVSRLFWLTFLCLAATGAAFSVVSGGVACALATAWVAMKTPRRGNP